MCIICSHVFELYVNAIFLFLFVTCFFSLHHFKFILIDAVKPQILIYLLYSIHYMNRYYNFLFMNILAVLYFCCLKWCGSEHSSSRLLVHVWESFSRLDIYIYFGMKLPDCKLSFCGVNQDII